MAVFALLAAAGSWLAWRSNPMYSTRATLRFVAVVGLAVAAAVALIVAAAEFSAGRSIPVQLGCVYGATMLGLMGLIWVIVAMAMPKPAPLPPATRVGHRYRAVVFRWAAWFAGGVALLAVVAVLFPGAAAEIVYVLGGVAVSTGVATLFALYLAAANVDRSLASVEATPWVHWRYTPEEWNMWTTAGGKAESPALRKLLARAAPETYFAHDGLFADGVYTEWLTPGNYLLEARVDERPPRSLTFVFASVVPGAYGSTTAELRRDVLIPPGADADIAAIARELSAVCPAARIDLT